MEATVLTSENSAAFYAKKLDLAPEPAEPAVESVSEEAEAPEKAAQQEPNPESKQDEGKEKQQKVHVRFSELTEQRKAAEAKVQAAEATAKAEREARVLAEKKAAELEAKFNPPKPDDLGPEPLQEQFNDAKEYAKAYADWSIEKRDKEAAQKQTLAARQKVVDTFVERQNKFKEATPDYQAVIDASTVQVSNDVRDAIVESEVGPQLLHYLATHQEDAEALKGLSIPSQLKRIGKLEALFEAKPSEKPKATEKAAAAQEISRAPAPITPLKATDSTPDVPVNSKGEFYGTLEQYKAARKAGKI